MSLEHPRGALIVLAVAACSDPTAPRPAPLGALPASTAIDTDRFADSTKCAQCHLADTDASALHDAAGRDISPVRLWRASMMALAARDPYYLAVFGDELARAPVARDTIEGACTRCHGPAGSEEVAPDHLTFADLTTNTTPAAALAREGVTCTLCHQIGANDLGTPTTFSGGFETGYTRKIFGLYALPMADPMMFFVRYIPVGGAHLGEAGLCATCHVVDVQPLDAAGHPVGAPVMEQATFLEWRASSVAATTTCQGCHVPVVDDDGHAITTRAARYPATTIARAPFGRHVFVGGNAYMLRLINANRDWAMPDAPADDLEAQAVRSEAHLASAARVTIVNAIRDGGDLVVQVRVVNRTGHKLPTGYPSRRVWLHLAVSQGGSTVFESGAVDASGRLVDGHGAPLASGILPHRDQITRDDEVQVWEAVLVDVDGTPTHRALDARRYDKDDRILPAGWTDATADGLATAPVGVIADASFVAGQDDVTYRIPVAAGAAHVEVELRYQSVRPETIDALDQQPTPASVRFVDQARARPMTPSVLATVRADVP